MKKLTLTEFSRLTDEERDDYVDEMHDNLNTKEEKQNDRTNKLAGRRT